jgi:hypothetical protein
MRLLLLWMGLGRRCVLRLLVFFPPHVQVSVLILCAETKRGGHTQAVPAQARNQRVRRL